LIRYQTILLYFFLRFLSTYLSESGQDQTKEKIHGCHAENPEFSVSALRPQPPDGGYSDRGQEYGARDDPILSLAPGPDSVIKKEGTGRQPEKRDSDFQSKPERKIQQKRPDRLLFFPVSLFSMSMPRLTPMLHGLPPLRFILPVLYCIPKTAGI
jgi:hypothetical protein